MRSSQIVSCRAQKINFAFFSLVLTLLTLAMLSSRATGQDSVAKLKIGAAMPGFELKDFQGKTVSSVEYKSKKTVAIIFFGVECPLVKLYSSRLTELEKKFGEDFQVVAINSNRHDSITEIQGFAKKTEVTFPLLKDPANRIADSFGALRTPEVFLFDADQKLVYRGAIDDQYSYGIQKPIAKNNYLSDAIKSTLNGSAPQVAETEAIGCIIGRIREQQPSEVTYSKQVSRILNEHCVKCHRSGEVAPFSLTDYDEVVGWSEMIEEVIAERRMPPWHASPKHGTFKNDISLSKDEIALISIWVKNGAPEGDTSDLPEPPNFIEGWQIGKPDVVIAMTDTPFKVPATGVIPYKHFVVETGFTEGKWIRSAEIRIGNRAVVHHVIVALHKSGDVKSHGQIGSEWLTATAPGSKPLELPDGYAKYIPAGAKLVFQMHYTPNGTAQTDISKVGFVFADPETVKKSVGTREILNRRFRIPPGEGNHPVEARYRFKTDSLVLGLFPHMHLRGKSFRYTAKYPDGKKEILLDIPNYDFNWQTGYEFPEPRLFPRGTVIQCLAHFDNSEDNLANPNPGKTVRWGDQTWDEMMIGYFDMALADQDLTKKKK